MKRATVFSLALLKRRTILAVCVVQEKRRMCDRDEDTQCGGGRRPGRPSSQSASSLILSVPLSLTRNQPDTFIRHYSLKYPREARLFSRLSAWHLLHYFQEFLIRLKSLCDSKILIRLGSRVVNFEVALNS